VIAKWAMTLDGKIATRRGDSQWISSPSSRRHVHQLRGRVDAVVVGVGTVAADDPQLTARPAGPRLAARVVVDPHLRTPLESRLVQTARVVPVLIAGRICERPARAAALRAAGCELLSTIETSPSDIARETLLTLAARGMTNVLVEGGGGLLGSLRDGGLIDEVHVFIAPRLAGGAAAVTPLAGVGVGSITDADTLDDWVVRKVERDLWISGRVRRGS
jgi:diaminohydroxyphosphoribosylaminopyrimidine deaminase/5-amino-6-(5-phosphoribosylamino)uracil reductase